MKRSLTASLCFVYLSSLLARPLCAAGFREVPQAVGFPVRDVAVEAPLDGLASQPGHPEISADALKSDALKTEEAFLPLDEKRIGARNSIAEPTAVLSRQGSGIVGDAARKYSAHRDSSRLKFSAIGKLFAIHAAIARVSGADSIEAVSQKSEFADFYAGFLQELNSKFASPEYKANRALFLHDIEQSRFHAARAGLGELEAKLIDGHVCIRFSSKGKKPLIAVIANIPLAVNAGLAPLPIKSQDSQQILSPQIDPPLGSKKLDTYRSRLLMNRKVHFSRLLTEGSMGDPHRTILIIDHLSGESLVSPALGKINKRWFKHWFKGTIEPFHYGDLFRGVLSSSIQFGLAYSVAVIAAHLNPSADAFTWGPAIAAGLFSLILATMSDSYYSFVQRGDNRNWEMIKRLLVSVALSYPIFIMQAHGDWSVIFTLKTNIIVWLVGFGDRYLSTVTSVVPKIHQKYFMKPWFFPVRMKVPFRDLAARLTGDASLRNSTTKGVLMTREALAIPRFAVRFLGLFLDPAMMAYTHGIPVATMLLWSLGLPVEIFNYYAIKKLARENPRIQEEFAPLKARRDRAIMRGSAASKIFKRAADRWMRLFSLKRRKP